MDVPQHRHGRKVVADGELVEFIAGALGDDLIGDPVGGDGDLEQARVLGAVLAADQGPDIAFGAVAFVGLRRLVELGELALESSAQPARVMIVEDDAGIGGRARIVWQQRGFGASAQHDQLAVAAWPDPHQCGAGPRVDQPTARAAVQHVGAAVAGSIRHELPTPSSPVRIAATWVPSQLISSAVPSGAPAGHESMRRASRSSGSVVTTQI